MLRFEFNLKNYNKILNRILEANYTFIKFPMNGDSELSAQNRILLRHDIDFSIDGALELAKHDQLAGIQSTFFIYLNSPFYNILFKKDKSKIEQIILMGHDIALHYDNKSDFSALKEIDLLKSIFPSARHDIISLHRPKFHSNGSLNKQNQINSNLTTTYDAKYFKQIGYLSDSKCRFKIEELDLILKSKKNFQLLIHPVWWYFEGKIPKHKIDNLKNERVEVLGQNVKNNLSINIDLEVL